MTTSAAALVSVVVLLASGCSSRDAVSEPAADQLVDPKALEPVTLPDLSRAQPSVRDQTRDRYAFLQQRIDRLRTVPTELGAAYGEMGKLFMAAEFSDAAEACFHNAEALAPRDARWPYYRAQLYRIRGDTPRSIAAFERTLKLQADDVPTLVWLANAYLEQGSPQAAERLLVKALSVQPRSVAALLGLGRAELAKRDYAMVAQHLEQALIIDPQAAIAHYPLAMAYRALGNREKAEAHLQHRGTIEVKPDDPLMKELEGLLQSTVAYEAGGSDALNRGDFPTAAESFRKAITLAPNDPALHHKLGTALALSGNPRGAFEEFQHAVRVSPTFARGHYSLGVLSAASGDHQKAIAYFERALKAEPEYVDAQVQLANELRRSGRLAESLRLYADVTRRDPRVAEARFGYATSLIRLGRYAEARDYITESMALDPSDVAFPRILARLLAAAPVDQVRDGRRALALAQKLLEPQPRTVELLETIAMASAETERYDDAVMWQREAIAEAEREGRHDIAQLIADNLRRYESHRPCRVPWRPGEPIELVTPSIAPPPSRS